MGHYLKGAVSKGAVPFFLRSVRMLFTLGSFWPCIEGAATRIIISNNALKALIR